MSVYNLSKNNGMYLNYTFKNNNHWIKLENNKNVYRLVIGHKLFEEASLRFFINKDYQFDELKNPETAGLKIIDPESKDVMYAANFLIAFSVINRDDILHLITIPNDKFLTHLLVLDIEDLCKKIEEHGDDVMKELADTAWLNREAYRKYQQTDEYKKKQKENKGED